MDLTIKVKYFTEQPPLEFVDGKSDWIDLRCSHEIYIPQFHSAKIPLGVAMKLPEGYCAILVPRSSTFGKYGIIQTNSIGVIDNSYCGDNDEWMMPVYALGKDCYIQAGTRIAQFKLVPNESAFFDVKFEKVEYLEDADRGGFGSTGDI